MNDLVTPKLEQARALMQQRLRGQVRDLRLILRETQVVLQGVAISYYAKQLAQQMVLPLLLDLVNEIEVQRMDCPPGPSDGDAR